MIECKIIVGDDKTISISGFPGDEIVCLGLLEKVKVMLVDHFKARESVILRPGIDVPAGLPAGAGLRSVPGAAAGNGSPA